MKQFVNFADMMPISEEFIESLKELPGVDVAALVASLETAPGIGVRLNRHKEADKQLPEVFREAAVKPVDWCADGAILAERPRFSLDPLWHAGAYYVQDSSSMIYQRIVERLAERRVKDTPDGEALRVLDFCAAPGGKTTAIINGLPYGTQVVANEYVAQRGKILRENLERWGYPYVITTGCESSRYASLPPIFDIVAVDAPCSGEGMMRKDEEARRQWSTSLVKECATLQKEILSDIAKVVKPGGFLIYSTCTFNLQENEENSRFIESLGFHPVSIDSLQILPEGKGACGQPMSSLMEGVEALRFMPHVTPTGEGLYLSIFQRPGDEGREEPPFSPHESDYSTAKKSKSRKGKEKEESQISKKMEGVLSEWVNPQIHPEFRRSDTLVSMIPADITPLYRILESNRIHITGAGLPIGEIKGIGDRTEVLPDSRMVMSMAYREGAFPEVELLKEDALRYLKRESIILPPNIPKGYVVVTYEGRRLGLTKNLGNRANNLYPQAWRIR